MDPAAQDAGLPGVPRQSVFARIAGVILTPNQTLASVVQRPDVRIMPLIIVLMSALSGVLLAPRLAYHSLGPQIAAQSPNLSTADVDRMVRLAGAFGKVSAYASPLVVLIGLLVVAGVLLLVFQLFGGQGTFRQAFSVVAYAWIPRVIQSVVLTGIVLFRHTVDVSEIPTLLRSNLSFLVDTSEQPVIFTLLSSADLFTLWSVALLIIGFSYLSRQSRARSATLILSLWLTVIVIKLGFAAMGAAKMRGGL